VVLSLGGIECEGGSGLSGPVPALWKTGRDAVELRDDDRMLIHSARLVAYLCTKNGIRIQHDHTRPPRRDTVSHVAGHDKMAGNDHLDSGPEFPWRAYMRLVHLFAAK
jgi:hypothetical protein